MLATWTQPQEGNIHLRIEKECTKILEYLDKKYEKLDKPTMTHIGVRLLAELLADKASPLNGKIVFDKFVPFSDVRINILVDIKEGKDLAGITVENANRKSFKQIQEDIKKVVQNIKKNDGDTAHKSRNSLFKLVPPFIIRIINKIGYSIAFNFSMSIKPMNVKKHLFGPGMVTSLGMYNVKDAFVPMAPMLNQSVILFIGKIEDRPVVKNGQIVIAPMVNLNFTADHRYVDGGLEKKILECIDDFFDNPERYDKEYN